MTIEQTIDIPIDRRLHLDFEVPREIPAGKARVELKVIPFVKKQDAMQENDDNRATPRADRLLGVLAGLGDISLEEIREERLAKYLK
jgi:hypothetical protein